MSLSAQDLCKRKKERWLQTFFSHLGNKEQEIYSLRHQLQHNRIYHSRCTSGTGRIVNHVQIIIRSFQMLEPICCKKQQKSSWPVAGLWNRGYLDILNDQRNHLDSNTISLESFRFRGPLFRKPVTGQELFFCRF